VALRGLVSKRACPLKKRTGSKVGSKSSAVEVCFVIAERLLNNLGNSRLVLSQDRFIGSPLLHRSLVIRCY
jgi:hypothetical protein